jgi:hypothetical protein
MKHLGTLLRTTAGAALLAFGACATETESLPVSDAPPAHERTAPAAPPADMMPRQHPDLAPHGARGLPELPPGHPPIDRAPGDPAAPGMDGGRIPGEVEADIRQRYRRGPIWVA